MYPPPPIPQLQGSENIKEWMRAVRYHMRMHGLMGHLDGTSDVPDDYPSSDDYQQYVNGRAHAIRLITKNIKPVESLLDAECWGDGPLDDPSEYWNTIVEAFPVPEKPTHMHTGTELFHKLMALKINPDAATCGHSISQFMAEFHYLVDRLAEQGTPAAPELKVALVLRAVGLASHMDTSDMTWEEAHTMIMAMAKREAEGEH
ncbi:hypothetical protein O1611_g6862 [Lasiodiplodia mahajangana]|uniref:Uncharacterized protein n=1 Tax=Lasiodiplodia mahajangana TaxID=1108764 RepID=A0ACC2JHD5_9PEZI|nr:hypothetical protein O1611_g6862 [Lasiodiplodia mahajangana]